jgi:sister-chromatid-cohesion protein PDS5
LDELSSITEAEPENIDLATFATVRKDLIAPSMILHKDKGVRAYVACCIAELLNVYAPDAPYTAAELKVRRDGFTTLLVFPHKFAWPP